MAKSLFDIYKNLILICDETYARQYKSKSKVKRVQVSKSTLDKNLFRSEKSANNELPKNQMGLVIRRKAVHGMLKEKINSWTLSWTIRYLQRLELAPRFHRFFIISLG